MIEKMILFNLAPKYIDMYAILGYIMFGTKIIKARNRRFYGKDD